MLSETLKMMKNTTKKMGQFGSSTKGSYMNSLRKQNMTSTKPSTLSRDYKQGKFGSKKTKLDRQLSTPANAVSISPFDNLNKALYSDKNISLKGLMSTNSKTGVMGRPDIVKAQQLFLTKVKASELVSKTTKTGNKLSLFGNYMKGSYMFNPTSTSLTSKGWNLDIPDTFIKSGNTYKAPTTTYKTYKKSGRKSQYSTYNPTVITMFDGKDRIKNITEKGIYKKEYDGGRRSKSYYGLYDSIVKDFQENRFLKSSVKQATFKDDDRDGGEYTDYTRAVRKSSENLYDLQGRKLSKKTYGDYQSSGWERNEYGRGSEDRDHNRRKSYVKTAENYNDGKLASKFTWSPFEDYNETERGDRYREEDTSQKIALMKEEYYAGGTKIGELGYKVYNKAEKQNRSYNRDDYVKNYFPGYGADSANPAFTYDPGVDNEIIKKNTKEQGVALQQFSLLNPTTGKTTTTRFW